MRRTQDELGAQPVGCDGVEPPAAGRLPEEGEEPEPVSLFVSLFVSGHILTLPEPRGKTLFWFWSSKLNVAATGCHVG